MRTITATRLTWCVLAVAGIGAAAACGSDPAPVFGGSTTTTSGAGAGDAGSSSTSVGGYGGAGGATTTTTTTTGVPGCDAQPDEDKDGDGFSIAQGDCHDCDPNIGPNAVEVVSDDGPAVDDDCNGVVDDVPAPCDAGLPVDDVDGMSAAKAIELCKPSAKPGVWGVASAKYVLADGAPPPTNAGNHFHIGHGVLPALGANGPRAGARVLALSTGTARDPSDPEFVLNGYDKGYGSVPAPSFDIQLCDGLNSQGYAAESIGLELVVRAPANAHGLALDYAFFTRSWPSYVCNAVTDVFAAFVEPPPAGSQSGNIAFDPFYGPASQSTMLLDVCGCAGGSPCQAGGKSFPCAEGTAGLVGTGFETRGGTGWLRSTTPLEPNQEITLRFAIWTGAVYPDATVLVDNVAWLADPATALVTEPL